VATLAASVVAACGSTLPSPPLASPTAGASVDPAMVVWMVLNQRDHDVVVELRSANSAIDLQIPPRRFVNLPYHVGRREGVADATVGLLDEQCRVVASVPLVKWDESQVVVVSADGSVSVETLTNENSAMVSPPEAAATFIPYAPCVPPSMGPAKSP
jgi:hypothetical protein